MQILGHHSECPQLFLSRPMVYRIFSYASGFGILISSAFTNLTILTGAFIWFLVWVFSGKRGRQKAYNVFREIMSDIAANENNPTEKVKILKFANKTDSELADEVDHLLKLGGG